MFKKLDPVTVIVVGICIVLLFSWNTIFGPQGLNLIPAPQPKQDTVQTDEQKENVETVVAPKFDESKTEVKQSETTQELKKADAKTDEKSVIAFEKEFPIFTISSEDFDVAINPAKGEVKSISLNQFWDRDKENPVVLNEDVTPGALSVYDPNNEWSLVDVEKPIISNEGKSASVVRTLKNTQGQKFTVKQDWTLEEGYKVKYDVSIKNISDELIQFYTLDFSAGGIPTLQYLTGDKTRTTSSHRLDTYLTQSKKMFDLKASKIDKDVESTQNEMASWISLSNLYFAVILKQTDENNSFRGGNVYTVYPVSKEVDGKEEKSEMLTSSGRYKGVNIQPANTETWNFEYYAGPKELSLLKAFTPKATKVMHLAFSILEPIAQWLLYALIFINGIVGNYGLAIIILTILVKLAFWPIQHKANTSMKKMQTIQPMMKELREKYKDDKQVLNQKMMELYREEKVNPLGGCLPMLVQIPVLFAMYWTFSGAIEIRQASFLWAHDLAQPDTIGYIFGLAINPLAILFAVTMVLNQLLTPTAGDPAQARMMMLMPIIMLFFLYSLPSGLTLYWTVSNIISIIQLLFNNREKYFKPKDKNPKTA